MRVYLTFRFTCISSIVTFISSISIGPFYVTSILKTNDAYLYQIMNVYYFQTFTHYLLSAPTRFYVVLLVDFTCTFIHPCICYFKSCCTTIINHKLPFWPTVSFLVFHRNPWRASHWLKRVCASSELETPKSRDSFVPVAAAAASCAFCFRVCLEFSMR